MTFDDSEAHRRFKVVVNDEEQYSIWPEERSAPLGWRDIGVSGSKADCLDHIERVWVDMRPLSLRRWMDEQAAAPAPAPAPTSPADEGPDLVDRLAIGQHPVTLCLRPGATLDRLRQAIDRGVVHVRFTETRGGTELGVDLDPSACRLDALSAGAGTIEIAGTLELDFRPVRCRAIVDVATFAGTGRLEPLDRTDPGPEGR
jgi:uncharacterized protein YbdZ (MbtH family)